MVDYAQYVADLYQKELGRTPDAGAQGWIDALASNAMTPAQVQQMIDASPEGAVYDAYQSELGRAPDEGGRASWTGAVSGGMTEQQLIDQIRQSQEYQQLASEQYGGLLGDVYKQELGRAPDAGGLASWSAGLRSGAVKPGDLAAQFNASPEGYVYDLYTQMFNRGLDPSAYQWVDALNSGALTREQVRQGLMNSPEYQSLYGNKNPTQAPKTPTTQPRLPTVNQGNINPYGPNTRMATGPYSSVSVFDNYTPMRPLPSPKDQPFGFLYDTINQRLGRDVSARGLLDDVTGMQNAAAIQGSGVSTPVTSYNQYASSAQTQTPTMTGGYAGTPTGSTGGYTYQDVAPGPTNSTYDQWAAGQSNPNMVGGLLGAQSLVKNAYSELLGRTPDDAGMSSWTNAVYGGGLTQQQLYDAIRSSPEYQARIAGPVSNNDGNFFYAADGGGNG
jgi:hypothetical protein